MKNGKEKAAAEFFKGDNGDLCAVFVNVPAAHNEPEMRRAVYVNASDGVADCCDADLDFISRTMSPMVYAEDVGRMVTACAAKGFKVRPVNLPPVLKDGPVPKPCGAFACGADLCNRECEKAGETPARVHLVDVLKADYEKAVEADKGRGAYSEKTQKAAAAYNAALIAAEGGAPSTFTPGPLKAARVFQNNAPDCFAVSRAVWGGENTALCAKEEDARLYASAPDLLAALEAVEKCLDFYIAPTGFSEAYGVEFTAKKHEFDALEQARAAIFKARNGR